jgi:hypothetical protein
MSRKYIKQINDLDFVYPNNKLAEYDVEIVHDINENSVSGTVVSLSATTASSTGITFSISTTWSLNNAEPFIRNSNLLSIYSVHMLAPGQNYYKPWRVVHSRGSSSITATTFSETGATFTVSPALAGVSSFVPGTYYFEVRFIGHRSIYPVCVTRTLSVPPFPPQPTPTPTPTATPTPTTTPTPTPTIDYCCASGTTLNVTNTGWVKWVLCDGTDQYHQYTTTGNKVIPECIRRGTVTYGFPYADLAEFTVTGTGTTCGGICVGPTPTPTSTLPGGLSQYDNSGRGNDVADACNDALINARTFYSDCDAGSFTTGCYIYTDTSLTPLTGFTRVFIGGAIGANYDINSVTGQITGLSSVQC